MALKITTHHDSPVPPTEGCTRRETGRRSSHQSVVWFVGILLSVMAFDVAAASSLSSGSATSPKARIGGGAEFALRVVDEAGSPLVGAELVGTVEVNPGPVASTCCMEKTYAKAVTDRDGRAQLAPPPFTFRAVGLRVSYRNWPPRTVPLGTFPFKASERIIVLGPLRDVAGRVEPDKGCADKNLQVKASPPETSADVGPDGRFVLHGIVPWARVWWSACGRTAIVLLEERRNEPLVLVLPPLKQ